MEQTKVKVPWYGYVSLIVTIIILSGLLQMLPDPWSSLDFQSMVGKWGEVASVDGGITTYRGTGGFAARDSFLFVVSLAPSVMLAFAIIEVCIDYHGLLAAEKLLTPVMRPLMGMRGAAAVSLVGSFTSADVGAGTTRNLYEEGYMSERERLIMIAFQYSAPALVVNFFSLGAAAMPLITANASIVLLVIVVMKFVGANAFRIYLNFVKGKVSE